MDANHPKDKDQQPKRRKDKYNPYDIFSVGINTDKPHFYISFTDVQRIEHCIEISEELYRIFDRFELDDVAFLNEVDRHYERSEQTEENIASREAISHVSGRKKHCGLFRTSCFTKQSPNCRIYSDAD